MFKSHSVRHQPTDSKHKCVPTINSSNNSTDSQCGAGACAASNDGKQMKRTHSNKIHDTSLDLARVIKRVLSKSPRKIDLDRYPDIAVNWGFSAPAGCQS